MNNEYLKYERKIDIYVDPTEKILFGFIKEFIQKNLNFKILICGGWVRDKVMDKSSKDVDMIVTWDDKNRFIEFLDAKCKEKELNFKIGQKEMPLTLGVCQGMSLHKITFKDLEIDLREWKSDKTLEDDVLTRDFTCNSLYYDIKSGNILDLRNAIEDIKNDRTIRLVGTFNQTFDKDYGRFFRLIRFHVEKEMKIDTKIEEKIAKSFLNNFRPEDTKREFEKLFNSKNVKKCLEKIDELKLHKLIDRKYAEDHLSLIISYINRITDFLNDDFYLNRIRPYQTCYFNKNVLFRFCEAHFRFRQFRTEIEISGGKQKFKILKKKSENFDDLVLETILESSEFIKEMEVGFPSLVIFLIKLGAEIKNAAKLEIIEKFFKIGFEELRNSLKTLEEYKYFYSINPFEEENIQKEDDLICSFSMNAKDSELRKLSVFILEERILSKPEKIGRFKNLVIKIAEARYKNRKKLGEFLDFLLQNKSIEKMNKCNDGNDLLKILFEGIFFFEDRKIARFADTKQRENYKKFVSMAERNI